MRKGMAVLLAGLFVLNNAPAYAEEMEKQRGDNASDSGANEIQICNKEIPLDVSISPEFADKYRLSGQTKDDYDGAQVLGGDRVAALKKYEVTKRIEYSIACELERLGYVAAKPIKAVGVITDFRLRSAEVLFLPITRAAAGEDKLTVRLDVLVSGNDKPFQFSVSDSTKKAGFGKTVPTQRLEYMVKNITKDAINKVLKEGFIVEPYALSSGDSSPSMVDSIATGNREVLRRLTKSLSKQKEPIDVAILDKVADRIHHSQTETDGDMADTLSHMCKLLGGSKNGKYKQMLREVAEKAGHKTLRKYAAKSAEQLPDTGEQQYTPVKITKL